MGKHIKAKVQGTLFDKVARLEELHEMGDPLARLDAVVDWAVFAPILSRLPKVAPKGPGGRPAFEPGLMFKVPVIQSLYGVSAVAVPIRDPWGAIIASIGASAPTVRMQKAKQFEESLKILREGAAAIEQIWGDTMQAESAPAGTRRGAPRKFVN